MMLLRELFPWLLNRKSDAPTTLRPMMTISIPSHSLLLRSRPKKAVDNKPVKIITAPA